MAAPADFEGGGKRLLPRLPLSLPPSSGRLLLALELDLCLRCLDFSSSSNPRSRSSKSLFRSISPPSARALDDDLPLRLLEWPRSLRSDLDDEPPAKDLSIDS